LYGRRLPAYGVGYEVLSAVIMYGNIFRDVTLCSLENVYQYSSETMENAYQTTDLNIILRYFPFNRLEEFYLP
jgi:hypothetical protein